MVEKKLSEALRQVNIHGQPHKGIVEGRVYMNIERKPV
jgi:hypothetical protein